MKESCQFLLKQTLVVKTGEIQMLVPSRKAAELTGLHPNTLRKYADEGRIKAEVLPSGHRRYDVSSLPTGSEPRQCGVLCYCRVSSAKQKNDLARQVAFMRQNFPGADIIQDVGSGLNFKRKGLRTILERLVRGDKLTLIVAHRDRLCRFGFDMFEWLIEKNGGELMVLEGNEHSPEQELTHDLLSILHVFSCRMHGLRRYTDEIKKDPNLSNVETA